MRDGYRVIDADGHIIEPSGLWSDYIAAEFRDRAPTEVVELGELVAGTRRGRTSPEQISLYKSVGIAVQDAAAAALVLAAARERSVGREIELEVR